MTGAPAGAVRWGTEISFRLGPGTLDDARALAATLAGEAVGSTEHVLFVDEDAGEYGCLAVWPGRDVADAYGRRPAVANVLAHLAELTGKEPRVRCYRMETQTRPE